MPQERTLAASTTAHNYHYLAGIYFKVNPIQDPLGAESLCHLADFNNRSFTGFH
jgi:hypothetical protein